MYNPSVRFPRRKIPRMKENPLIYAACDKKYFQKHAYAFIKSAFQAQHDVHIIVSPEPGEKLEERKRSLQKYLDIFARKFDTSINTLTIEAVADPRACAKISNRKERIVFYQSLRFFYINKILSNNDRPVYMMDIDSLVRKPLPSIHKGNLGIYLRLDNKTGKNRDEVLGMKVLAAMIYCTQPSAEFFKKVVEYIDTHPRKYFLDQRAIYEVYLEDKSVAVFDLAKEKILDWSFNNKSSVWTAKGKRRRRDPVYIHERLQYEDRSAIARKAIQLLYRIGMIRK